MCSIPTPADPLRYVALVRSIARQFYRPCNLALEDLEQEGIVGLLRAARHYDARTPPIGYFAARIRWAMLDALERHHRQTMLELQTSGPDPLDVLDDVDVDASPFELSEWLEVLSERERRHRRGAWLGWCWTANAAELRGDRPGRGREPAADTPAPPALAGEGEGEGDQWPVVARKSSDSLLAAALARGDTIARAAKASLWRRRK